MYILVNTLILLCAHTLIAASESTWSPTSGCSVTMYTSLRGVGQTPLSRITLAWHPHSVN